MTKPEINEEFTEKVPCELFESLLGQTIVSIDRKYDDDELIFTTKDNVYIMYHDQECCEGVWLEDVCGDFEDIINSPILMAEVAVNDKIKDGDVDEYLDECSMWTFYKLATQKGSVTLRWVGTSNGYYSVSVDFEKKDD